MATVEKTNIEQDKTLRRPAPYAVKRWVFSSIPLVAILLLLELMCRGWLYFIAPAEDYRKYAVPSEFPTAAKYVPHHYLCYALQPGYSNGGTTHNSLGFRGPEIVLPKPAGLFRIVILGGSTTYGEFIDRDEETFPAQLETVLRNEFGYRNVEVINAGVPGYSSWESLGNLAYRVLDWEADLVIPYHGVNDVHTRLVRPDSYRSDNSGRRTIWAEPIDVRICKHSVLLRVIGYHAGLWRLPGVDSFVQAPTSDPGTHGPSSAIGGDPNDVLEQNPPIYSERNLRSIVAIARAHGASVAMATWASSHLMGDYAATPHYRRGFDEHNALVIRLADELDCPCLDFASRMSPSPEYWRDGRHVNARGALMQAKEFASFLDASSMIPRGTDSKSSPIDSRGSAATAN